MKAQIKILVALVCVALTSCGGNDIAQHAQSLRVENKTVKLENDSVRLDLNYPFIEDSDHPQFDKTFNEHIEKTIKKLSIPNPEVEIEGSYTFESVLRWNMHYGEKIVALEWGGFTSINNVLGDFRGVELFDTQTGALYKWSDFILDSAAILDIVREELQSEQIPIGKSKKLHLPKFFTIDSLVLTAIYGVNELAPAEFGEIEIPIPLEDLEGAFDIEKLAPKTLHHVQQ